MIATIRHINSEHDPVLPSLEQLYLDSFPPYERVEFTDIVSSAKSKSKSEALIVFLDEYDKLLGFANYSIYIKQKIAFLLYIAVDKNKRHIGIGTYIYNYVINQVFNTIDDIDLVFFEVERPDWVVAEQVQEAIDRMRFYRTNGANLLDGIDYYQKVAGQPPIPMHIMIHLKKTTTSVAAYAKMKRALSDVLGISEIVTIPGLEVL